MSILNSFNVPSAELDDGVIVRRAGLFFRKRIRLAEVERVVAINRDALTHEEVMVGFLGAKGNEVWLSEFDKNFSTVMGTLQNLLPGFVGLEGFISQKPFEKMERVLWSRSS